VERVVLNALGENAAMLPDICASGDDFAIVFRRSRSTLCNGTRRADCSYHSNANRGEEDRAKDRLQSWRYEYAVSVHDHATTLIVIASFAITDTQVRFLLGSAQGRQYF
jgi:hypothetical protein